MAERKVTGEEKTREGINDKNPIRLPWHSLLDIKKHWNFKGFDGSKCEVYHTFTTLYKNSFFS